MRLIHIFFIGVISIVLSSCFELIEDVTLQKNGNGHVKFILNASQSKTDINALLLVKEVNGYKVPSLSEMKAKVRAFKDTVSNSPGFSNVKTSFDDENFIVIFEADFDKVSRLNDGIYKLWKKFDPINANQELYFKFENNQFTRQPGRLFNALYTKLKPSDRSVLNGATYTALYRFNQIVLSRKNEATKISKNKNVVFLKLPLQLMLEKPSFWYNNIQLQP